jgi:hypothetical protein
VSDYRESSNQAKAVRRGIVEPRPIGGKKRQGKKTVVVEIRYPGLNLPFARDWHKFGAYEDRETAETVIANKTRGGNGRPEYRIKP